ncbi:hypothetical protein BO71DRAFT_353037 [Aspergillus ellipticus CBS 707.79]|uniref:Calcineurin-like phosphoesterase domain-containing protein n=1 Tax=Aspergillus ellipticus CBS 707.79 TaxID=1448320 RepID=A0A319DB58_9EURO|nr:hypothetical protein BO71DRAFT_353037 [Aspergillus ellipticus CBS 707.79]
MFHKLWSRVNRASSPFQVLSDLHLEVNRQYASYDFPVCAKQLILAGDIGRLADYDDYRDFLQKQTDRFELVFLVLGNHEFYNDTFTEGVERARQLEQESCFNGRLILLHQRRYDIPESNVTVLGCTLWSDVPSEAQDIVRSKIQDFRKIEGWTVNDHNASHESDLAWLLKEIQSTQRENGCAKTQPHERSVLVVTHHAPSLQRTSSPQHAESPWKFAFATEILSQVSRETNIKVWVFGHTHYTTEFTEGNIKVVSNQRGYVLPWSDPKVAKDEFDARKVIHV